MVQYTILQDYDRLIAKINSQLKAMQIKEGDFLSSVELLIETLEDGRPMFVADEAIFMDSKIQNKISSAMIMVCLQIDEGKYSLKTPETAFEGKRDRLNRDWILAL